LTADNFFQFFDAKVSGVGAATAVAPEPTFSVAQPSRRLERLAEISEQDVIKAAMSLNNSVTPTRYQLGYSRKTLRM